MEGHPATCLQRLLQDDRIIGDRWLFFLPFFMYSCISESSAVSMYLLFFNVIKEKVPYHMWSDK